MACNGFRKEYHYVVYVHLLILATSKTWCGGQTSGQSITVGTVQALIYYPILRQVVRCTNSHY